MSKEGERFGGGEVTPIKFPTEPAMFADVDCCGGKSLSVESCCDQLKPETLPRSGHHPFVSCDRSDSQRPTEGKKKNVHKVTRSQTARSRRRPSVRRRGERCPGRIVQKSR